jgi:hypothetical protein
MLSETLGMYHSCSSARIDERVNNAKLLKKSTIEKTYSSLVVEVKKLMNDADKRLVKDVLMTSLQLLTRKWGRRRGSS